MNAGLTIAVEAMSGDHGAAVAVPAALDVVAVTRDLRLLIVGRGEVVRPLVAGEWLNQALVPLVGPDAILRLQFSEAFLVEVIRYRISLLPK